MADQYRDKVQPVFNNRCIACHSCFNAPCQLNLQSYEGFTRGATKENVYNGTRLDSVLPTRMGIDAETEEEWRKMHFFSVNNSKNSNENLFYQMLRSKPLELKDLPSKPTEESMSCINDIETLKKVLAISEDMKMPYGLQPISDDYKNTLIDWLANGAKGPTETLKVTKKTQEEIKEWDKFFNGKTEKQKLVSRYIYEHLFLAHIYFENQNTFFRLVRSKTECSKRIEEIATRRPNDYPGRDDFYYCLKPLDSTNVAKTHMPFEFNPKKLETIKNIFYDKKWEVTPYKKLEETYTDAIAENPFISFKDIPAESRYKFLLDNAHYMVSTFIKGPVCNGSNALNSIQEQFYVLFLKPESGYLTSHTSNIEDTKDLLIMPGLWGSDVKLKDSIEFTKILVQKREEYRRKKHDWMLKNFTNGLQYSDLWNGDGVNDNAMLTVFRHDDNAVVVKGFKGDLSKTAFVLDYSLFERLVYNLVVNFDVFGNIGHQMLTRIYMDYIRMEAEENYLAFLPKEIRTNLRKSWYKGIFTNLKMNYLFPLLIKDFPTGIKYNDPKNAKVEFAQYIFDKYMSKEVRGEEDLINWKKLRPSTKLTKLTKIEKNIRDISSFKVKGRIRFPNFFPESSYLIVKKKDGTQDVYSVIKNREHENISWILGESLRLEPSEDTLTIEPGFMVFYPNFFWSVNEDQIEDFKNAVLKVSNLVDYKNLKAKFGVSRLALDFWDNYDLLNRKFKEQNPIEFGYLDLTRYLME